MSTNPIADDKIIKFADQNIDEVKEKLQKQIQALPEDLREANYLEVASRPWGIYYVMEDKPNYKVKKILVNPGQRLSLQSHKHRSEHWIMVTGTATVEIRNAGKEEKDWVYDIQPNESCYIKANTIHRVANYGKIPLVFIEVQVGEYTGEDDITRYEDDYNRVG
jgi:mannose-1-phosphate guanylyltransferase